MARRPDIGRALEAAVVRTLRSEVGADLRRLERRVEKLTKDLTRLTKRTRRSGKPSAPASPGRQRHGRYIGLLRHLPKRARATVRGVRKRQGVEAAIKVAERLRK